MDNYFHNLEKIKELHPDTQWAARMMLDHCWSLALTYRILEAYRSQARQNALYAQGRTKPGPIVTYTTRSMHSKRLAFDILPLNCTIAEIVPVALTYSITHPLAWDPPHFQLDKVEPERQRPKVLTPTAAKRKAARLTEPAKGRLERRLARNKTLPVASESDVIEG